MSKSHRTEIHGTKRTFHTFGVAVLVLLALLLLLLAKVLETRRIFYAWITFFLLLKNGVN